MPRLLTVCLLFAWVLPAAGAQAQAAPTCGYVLGFADFHTLLPHIIGACLTDETADPTTGNTLQQTSRGLLVWRKATNSAAFTDGARTLIQHDLSLLERPNGCRFAWEPNPGGLPLAGTPACAGETPTGSMFGVNVHPLNPTDYNAFSEATTLDDTTAVGASIVRLDIHWAWLEPIGPGTDLWTSDQVQHLDAFVADAARRHVQVLAVVTESPCWAIPVGYAGCSEGARADLPSDPQDFADFMGRLVARYKGQIHYWELWNEPNAVPGADPAAYANLLKAAYPAVKAADPTAVVVAGALAPVEADAGQGSTMGFLNGMYAAGAKGYFDVLSFHPYTNGPNPLWYDAQQPMHSYVQSVPALHQAMLQAGDTSPIWLTEVGWSTVATCDPAPGACWAPTLPTTDANQRSYLAESLVLAARWPYVSAVFWYELLDEGSAASVDALDHFGLYRHDLTAKPSAQWLAQQRSAQP